MFAMTSFFSKAARDGPPAGGGRLSGGGGGGGVGNAGREGQSQVSIYSTGKNNNSGEQFLYSL